MKNKNYVVVLLVGNVALVPHSMKITTDEGFMRFLRALPASRLVYA